MHILLCQCQGNAWAVLIQCRHKKYSFGGLLMSRPVLISLQFLLPECAAAKKRKKETLSSYFKENRCEKEMNPLSLSLLRQLCHCTTPVNVLGSKASLGASFLLCYVCNYHNEYIIFKSH